jgi:hypothetical protein
MILADENIHSYIITELRRAGILTKYKAATPVPLRYKKSIIMNRTYCYKCVIVLASLMGMLSMMS